MPDVGDKVVSCSFVTVRRTGNELIQVDVAIRTGSSPWRLRLRTAAHNFAYERNCQYWAMPCLVPRSGDWLVYEHNTGGEQSPVFLQRLPSRDAAEMWMLHDAERS